MKHGRSGMTVTIPGSERSDGRAAGVMAAICGLAAAGALDV
jgi:hypothetical protein